MADIESMFFQVRLPKDDCDYLRFLWWPNGDYRRKPEVYRMLVHLFGATSSPSVCNAALKRTAKDNASCFSQSSVDTINHNFYVDDYLKSVESEEQAVELIEEVSALCKKGGFHLTKWRSNSPSVLGSVELEERLKEVKTIDLQRDSLPDEHALGVYWSVESDCLGINVSVRERPATRRGLLSITSAVYDPLGLCAPFVLVAKQLLQDLCRKGVDWDQELTGSNLKKWHQWLNDLPDLQQVAVSRCYQPQGFGAVQSCELHLFADASERGYGVVAYLRFLDEREDIGCSFVLAKSRVVPLKKITIPRLELTAAMIAAKMSLVIKKALEFPIHKVVFWTDSQAVLNYINSDSGRFYTFVSNRLSVIRDISTPDQWRYVATNVNPADAASRGQDMKSFMDNQSWFNGPCFLSQPSDGWSVSPVSSDLPENDPEIRKPANALFKL